MKNAVAYLENVQPKGGRVYVKAVIAYALALANSPQKYNANQHLIDTALYDSGIFYIAFTGEDFRTVQQAITMPIEILHP